MLVFRIQKRGESSNLQIRLLLTCADCSLSVPTRTMSSDAQLNDMIRLKQPPAAPIERWQMLPARQRKGPRQTIAESGSVSTPLRLRTTINMSVTSVTPDRHKVVLKCRKTPKVNSPKTPMYSACLKRKTPGNSKRRTPPKSGKKKTPGRSPSGCRFIPNRASMDLDYSAYLLRKKEGKDGENEEDQDSDMFSPSGRECQQALLKAISRNRGKSGQKSVLSFSISTPSMAEGSSLNYTANMTNSINSHSIRSSQKRRVRRLPTTAEKVLDAPGLVDDYYLNVLDWGKNNLLAIGLGSSVFLWNAKDGSVHHLTDLDSENDYVSSVSWAGNGKYLAVGCTDAAIQLWDVAKERRVRVMHSHTERVGVLTWNSHTLTSGSQDAQIHSHDVRISKHCVAQYIHHKLEVCGLRWSPDGTRLASGGNDNIACVWNAGSGVIEPQNVLTDHRAAVKAVSWCPWRSNLLATGGGSNDRCIKLWNASTGKCQESIDTNSQVSALAWNRENKEIISSHGNPKNHLAVWKCSTMCKVGEITGHEARILQMSLSPRKSSVATISADETLRVWKCFDSPNKKTTDLSRSSREDSITALIRNVP